MRVGSTEDIKNSFENRTLEFGCAANWIDYEWKKHNGTTGDIHECTFAHLEKDDTQINSIVDVTGRPMGDHLLILQDMSDSTCFLCFIPTILTPVLCFYSFNVDKIREGMAVKDLADPSIKFDLNMYRNGMGYDANDSSFLLITDPVMFVDELHKQIPIAVRDNLQNLTSKRYYGEFNPEDPVTATAVVYDKHSEKELYFDRPGNQDELFWKYPKYAWQSELRFAIPNLNFAQTLDPDVEYDHKLNKLKVQLPKMQEYAKVFPASKARSLLFDRFDDETHTHRFAVLGAPDESAV